MAAKTKSNFELRFFLDQSLAKKLSSSWKKEGYKTKIYAFLDIYFKHERSAKKLAKIRKWKIPKFKPEVIFFERKNGVKSESRKKFKNLQTAVNFLEKQGYEKYLEIEKKKGVIFTNKSKKKVYVLENIKGLGWSGEVEIAKDQKQKIKDEIEYLKSLGVSSFTLSSMLEIMEQKLGIKKLKKPKIYRYSLLRI
ncbi:MAG: hypothetical protein QXO35_01745 [Candidatus Micrarchaeia archaeon]